MTIAPKKISINLILLLKKNGSINDVKNAPVLIVTNATETLDTLIALKKVIQCNAIMIPESKNFSIAFLSILNFFFRMIKYIAINIEANNILYHTNGIASIEMSFPKIAVNPQMKTMKCIKR